MQQRTISSDTTAHEEVLAELAPDGPSAAYIDLEASGLGDRSWPIEIGWAINGGEPESFLIRRHEDWPLAAWDPKAEELHGLSIEVLHEDGLDVVGACKRLNDALAGLTVYSDAPDWDGYWLYRLHTTARMRQTFKLAHFAELMPEISLTDKLMLVAKTNALAPHTHQAADDVRHMQVLHALAVIYEKNFRAQ